MAGDQQFLVIATAYPYISYTRKYISCLHRFVHMVPSNATWDLFLNYHMQLKIGRDQIFMGKCDAQKFNYAKNLNAIILCAPVIWYSIIHP